MPAITYLTNIERQAIMMQQMSKKNGDDGQGQVTGNIIYLHEEVWGPQWQQLFSHSTIVVFSWMGTSRDTTFMIKSVAVLQKNKITYTVLATDLQPDDTLHGVTEEEREIMRGYLLHSGADNYRNFWLWLAHTYCQQDCEYRLPQPLLWNGIFHPRAEKVYSDTAVYRSAFCQESRPTVGIVFPRDEWVWGDMAYQSMLIQELERQGLNVIGIFSHWSRNDELNVPGVDETVKRYFYEQELPIIDVMINSFKFSLTVGHPVDKEFLHKLGVPVLQAYALLQSYEEWQGRMEGMTPMEVSCSVAMPEFDGAIHGVPIASKERFADGTTGYVPIPERIIHMAKKAKKWALLRHKANGEKKIAIIFHNYPPSNSNIGSAQGLDSPASIILLLQQMAQQGYRVDHIPNDSQTFMNELIAQATNDRRYMSEQQISQAERIKAEQYQQWFTALAPENQEQLKKDWGKAPGEVFHYDGELLVPGMLNGNIFITVQPPRGFGEQPDKIYHSPDCAPTHHYLAYYHWVRDIWGADAVVHVGTHGSLEWLPGKGAGLSRQCYPDLSIGDLPNIYPYLITIVGEGIQAKRRGAACLIGHMTPPMSHADTYDELAELENLLDEYCHFKQNQPGNEQVVVDLIREQVAKCNLQQDLPEEAVSSFDDYVQQLHTYLTDIKNMQIRVGLHILGCPPRDDVLIEYLLALTRLDNGDIPSLPQIIASMYGYDYYKLLEQSGQMLPGGSKTYGALIDDIRLQCREVILLLAEYDFDRQQAAEKIAQLPWIAVMGEELQQQMRQVAVYICETVVPNLEKTEQEMIHLLGALEGRFVEPGPAGAPTSGMADILPTGRNFYGVDPRMLPTPAAWEIGQALGDQVIAQYVADEGYYPESIGMIMWSGANMRSRGQCIAEFLYLMGVRPVWQRGSKRVVDLEVIPLAELKRPRMDVTARISGLFRDTQPNGVKWMDKAVSMVSQLEEPLESNYVRKHVLADVQELERQGIESRQALVQACYRIFGCPPGAYGAGVGSLLEEKNWETVDDLAKVYVRWGAHAYGAASNGAFVPGLFSRRLSTLDVTVKNEDNREVHMLNSDDFNAYHGGMVAAVRSLGRKTPKSYCGDSSDRSHIVVRSLGEEFKRIFRGETMNPKYIDGMKRHGYKGAADLAGVVAHCYDWDATSEVMEDWMYDGLAEKYALDQKMQEWMKEVNPWALQRIAEKLLEAQQRGMWQADDKTKEELQQLYLEIEGDLEERSEG
jgi:cobaltochelatase CobN